MHRADNLATFVYRLYRNPGSLRLLEPSGSLQAYTGIVLPIICFSSNVVQRVCAV